MKKYFYIIHRDGQIFEIEDINNRYDGCMTQWQESGLISFPDLGININAVDISKIIDADKYENYIDSAQPKMFLKNGTWYLTKERNIPVRHEKWKQEELDNRKQLETSQEVELTDEQKKHNREIAREIGNMFKI